MRGGACLSRENGYNVTKESVVSIRNRRIIWWRRWSEMGSHVARLARVFGNNLPIGLVHLRHAAIVIVVVVPFELSTPLGRRDFCVAHCPQKSISQRSVFYMNCLLRISNWWSKTVFTDFESLFIPAIAKNSSETQN